MDKKMIRAYLWQDVIRLGFCPDGIRNQKRWLLEYGRSLRDFWEIDLCPNAPRKNNGRIMARIDCFRIDLCLDYTIDSSNTNFNVNFLYISPSTTKELMWVHDVDGDYFTFPAQVLLNSHNKRNIAVREFANDDIEAVVDGLLLHPAAHQHIKSPIDDHEIRIGGGIDNPFQYLFQLRYQLCPFEAKRRAEKNRLVLLFTEAIRNYSRTTSKISASQLMAQPDI